MYRESRWGPGGWPVKQGFQAEFIRGSLELPRVTRAESFPIAGPGAAQKSVQWPSRAQEVALLCPGSGECAQEARPQDGEPWWRVSPPSTNDKAPLLVSRSLGPP